MISKKITRNRELMNCIRKFWWSQFDTLPDGTRMVSVDDDFPAQKAWAEMSGLSYEGLIEDNNYYSFEKGLYLLWQVILAKDSVYRDYGIGATYNAMIRYAQPYLGWETAAIIRLLNRRSKKIAISSYEFEEYAKTAENIVRNYADDISDMKVGEIRFLCIDGAEGTPHRRGYKFFRPIFRLENGWFLHQHVSCAVGSPPTLWSVLARTSGRCENWGRTESTYKRVVGKLWHFIYAGLAEHWHMGMYLDNKMKALDAPSITRLREQYTLRRYNKFAEKYLFRHRPIIHVRKFQEVLNHA